MEAVVEERVSAWPQSSTATVATNALSFYSGKRVFVTGHTGFKGSWLCRMLQCAGAELTGYALDPPTEPSLFREAKIAQGMRSVIGDVRDADHLFRVFDETAPEVVFHLAAQPLVRRGYRLPVETFEINLMGTVNVLQCLRRSNQPVSAVIVTTDKVYRNRECDIGYNERDELGGSDPYAGSKACAEIACNATPSGSGAAGKPIMGSAPSTTPPCCRLPVIRNPGCGLPRFWVAGLESPA